MTSRARQREWRVRPTVPEHVRALTSRDALDVEADRSTRLCDTTFGRASVDRGVGLRYLRRGHRHCPSLITGPLIARVSTQLVRVCGAVPSHGVRPDEAAHRALASARDAAKSM